MNTLDSLLAGIVADPREETRWLVLADFLEENDQPDRAELLRLHRKLLATCLEPDSHPDRAAWQARVVELLVAGVRPCVPQETITLPGGVPMTFSFIPPGAFLMGLNVNSPERDPHCVTVTRGFFMGIYSVTQAQWASVMKTTPSQFKGEDRPVKMVSWDDCQDFCKRLTKHLQERVAVRLPTAVEWEFACRAGTTTRHYVGDDQLAMAAWFNANAGGETHPVGQLLPNAWNLYDMAGNVWQWCDDWWGHYSAEQLVDPIAPVGDVSRVYRGGGWPGPGGFCRTNSCSGNIPATRCGFVGLRVCFHPN